MRITVKKALHTRFFADKKFGGKRLARVAATEFRDSLIEKLPEERVAAIQNRRRAVRQSGVQGVTHVQVRSASGTVRCFWQAAWRLTDGRRRTARFSIDRLGDEGALDAATRHLESAKARGRTKKNVRPPVSET